MVTRGPLSDHRIRTARLNLLFSAVTTAVIILAAVYFGDFLLVALVAPLVSVWSVLAVLGLDGRRRVFGRRHHDESAESPPAG